MADVYHAGLALIAVTACVIVGRDAAPHTVTATSPRSLPQELARDAGAALLGKLRALPRTCAAA